MHPTEGSWREVLDREIDPVLQAYFDSHLTYCAECQAKLATLRDQRNGVAGLLEQLGGPAPARSAAETLRRAARKSSHRRMLAAATIALCLATAAGATVRAGLLGRLSDVFHPGPSPTSTIAPAAQASTGVPTSSGLAFDAPPRLEVAFQEWQGEGEIVIVLSPEPEFSISASSQSDYSVRRGRVTVANRGGRASYRIILPLSLTDASIRVAGREVFSRRGTTISTQARADGAGSYHLPLSLQPRSLP
jgi:anti-sigma factor RsiW